MNTYGLDKNSWAILNEIAINPLHQHNAELWVFGSRAIGKHKQFSDLDILVVTKRNLPEFLLSNIRSALEESDLPIKIDLVLNQELADSYRKNVDLQKTLIKV